MTQPVSAQVQLDRDPSLPPVGGGSDEASEPVQFAEVAPLMQLGDMMAPMAVRTAATLRLADHIASGTVRLADLASMVGVHVDALRRLLRFLVARGVFAEPETGLYALTDLARLLLDNHPARLRARFDLNGPVARADMSFIHLLDTIKTGEPSFSEMYGRPFWEDLNDNRERVIDFAAMMAANAAQSGIETEYDWTHVEHVVDVGGGNGTLIYPVLHAHPHVHGTIVDLPGTAETAKDALSAAGLSDRCDVVAGNFFDPLPAGADVYLLCKILHDWDDDNAAVILKRCAEAAGTAGRVLIVEMVVTGSEIDPEFTTYLDMQMLVYFGGKERTLEEYSSLAAAAGMNVELVGKGKWGASILECTAR